jgi:hypothetical protein
VERGREIWTAAERDAPQPNEAFAMTLLSKIERRKINQSIRGGNRKHVTRQTCKSTFVGMPNEGAIRSRGNYRSPSSLSTKARF